MVLPNAKQLIDADALISCFFYFRKWYSACI